MLTLSYFIDIDKAREVFKTVEQRKREEYSQTHDDYIHGKADAYQASIQLLDLVPREDVCLIKHSRWVEIEWGAYFECENCKFTTDYHLTTFCPKCGSLMDNPGGR